jgi:Xaa-Pro dipeptidase
LISETEIKHNKLKELIIKKNLSGILLATQTNFLWFTGGHRNDVLKNENYSLVYLFITEDNKYLISSDSDCDRVMDEELHDLGFNLIKYNWYDQTPFDAIKKIKPDAKIGSDFYTPDAVNIEEDLTILRIDLTQFEMEKVKKLSSDFSCLLTDFCFNLKPDITEKRLAADFIYECLKKDIRLHVVLVGSDERIFKYRHPVATDKLIRNNVLLATVAERDGINITTSRSMYFGKIPKDLTAKQEAVNYIEARFCFNSKPGIKLNEVLAHGKKAYNEMGFEGEWKNHTQGGILAYKPREILATESSNIMLKPNYLLSWNPTIPGAKSEDMILVKEDGTEQLSIDKRWPYSEIIIGDEKFIKPNILEL